MAKSKGKGKGRRQAANRSIERMIIWAIVISVVVLGIWYNTNRKTFIARMADIGFTAGDTR